MTDGCTKKEIVAQLARDLKLHPRQVSHVLEAFFNIVEQGLANGKRYEFRGFGVFSVVLKKQKIGRNPKKAAVSITIPERYAVQFKPSSYLKNLVRK
jgi:integration host factor subunit beta